MSSIRKDPFGAYHFTVEIDNENIAYPFRSVSGLKSESAVIDLEEGGFNTTTRKLIGRTKFPNIILKRGLCPSNTELWKLRERFMQDLPGPGGSGGIGRLTPTRISGVITQLGPHNTTMKWRFVGGWVCKWEGPDLDASKNEISIETIEIAHEGLALMGGEAAAAAAGGRVSAVSAGGVKSVAGGIGGLKQGVGQLQKGSAVLSSGVGGAAQAAVAQVAKTPNANPGGLREAVAGIKSAYRDVKQLQAEGRSVVNMARDVERFATDKNYRQSVALDVGAAAVFSAIGGREILNDLGLPGGRGSGGSRTGGGTPAPGSPPPPTKGPKK